MCQTVHDPADESWQEGGREREGLRTCCGRLLQTKSRGGATSAESGEGFPQSAGGAGGTFTCTAVGRREQGGLSAVSDKHLTPFESARLGDRK